MLWKEVACTPRVYKLWQQLRLDASDRLAFYLQHSEAFEVWTPGRAGEAPGGLRSAVRLDLPRIVARKGRWEARHGQGTARSTAASAPGPAGSSCNPRRGKSLDRAWLG